MADHHPVLLPQPQELAWGDGALDLRGGLRVQVDERAWPALQPALGALAEDVAAAGGRLTTSPRAAAAEAPLAIGTGAPHPEAATGLPEGAEGYSLTVDPSACGDGPHPTARSTACRPCARWWRRREVSPPAVAIRDWPALAMRASTWTSRGPWRRSPTGRTPSASSATTR